MMEITYFYTFLCITKSGVTKTNRIVLFWFLERSKVRETKLRYVKYLNINVEHGVELMCFTILDVLYTPM